MLRDDARAVSRRFLPSRIVHGTATTVVQEDAAQEEETEAMRRQQRWQRRQRQLDRGVCERSEIDDFHDVEGALQDTLNVGRCFMICSDLFEAVASFAIQGTMLLCPGLNCVA
jgi:hypothetical protein